MLQCITAIPAVAQSPPERLTFDVLTMEDGLSTFPVTDIIKDNKGFLWVGTVDGLNRYDGYGFRVFRHDATDSTSLPNNYINTNSLALDDEGNIWIGTKGGLGVFDPVSEEFSVFQHTPGDENSLSHDVVFHVLYSSAGEIWAGTQGGLDRYDAAKKTFVHYRHDPQNHQTLDANIVLSLLEDQEGTFWVGTVSGLNHLDPRTGLVERIPLPSAATPVWSLIKDQKGMIWAGTQRGLLYRYNPDSGEWTVFPLFDGIDVTEGAGYIMDLHEDVQGRIWAGSWNGGLFIYDPTKTHWSRVAHARDTPYSLPGNQVSAFYEDHTGKMWVGTWDGLAHVRSLKAFDHLDLEPLESTRATSVVAGADGTVWVGTSSGVIGTKSKEGISTKKKPVVYRRNPEGDAQISANEISSVMLDRMGLLWIGTSGGGLNRVDPETGEVTIFTAAPGRLNSNLIYKVLEDNEGQIWIGTVQGGINVFDPQTGQFNAYLYDTDDSTSIGSDEVWTLFQDSNGILWAGLIGGGLNKLVIEDKESFPPEIHVERYQTDPENPHAISSNSVIAIYEGEDGVLWIGTMGGGLNRFDPTTKEFKAYDIKSGYPFNNVSCILQDQRGFLWLSTNSGLFRFDEKKGEVKHYTVVDGLVSNVFFFDGCAKDAAGQFYFASVGGVTVFSPEEITHNQIEPAVALTGVNLFNQPMLLDSSTVYKQHISLEHNQNFVSFEYAALDFNIPEKNRYAYRLEGVDEGWVEAGGRRQADYPNLQPGEYNFYVRAANNDGFWSAQRSLVTLSIAPPYWERSWFRALVAGMVLCIGYLLYSYQRSKQKEIQATRQQIADDLHDDIGSKLSALNLFLSHFKTRDTFSEKEKQRIQFHSDSVSRMMSALRDVVWLADPGNESLYDLANRINKSAQMLTPGIKLKFNAEDIPKDVTLEMNVRRQLFLMMKEAIHNAVRHARASEIEIEMRTSKSALNITISDNGKGFDPSSGQTGQGLRSMPRRAREINAELNINSSEEKGTTVTIEVQI